MAWFQKNRQRPLNRAELGDCPASWSSVARCLPVTEFLNKQKIALNVCNEEMSLTFSTNQYIPPLSNGCSLQTSIIGVSVIIFRDFPLRLCCLTEAGRRGGAKASMSTTSASMPCFDLR